MASRSKWMLLAPLVVIAVGILLIGIKFHVENDLYSKETTIIKLLGLA